ncbi:MAG TPA: PAS domain S-box protein, partial [Acetobacteraceae bacterium]
MLQTYSDWLTASPMLTPHGFCLLWQPWLIWSYVAGDSATGLAYFVIPVALARFVRRRDDLAFKPMFWLFAAFILLCGTTHWLELLTIWVPAYRLEAVAKLTTAVASVATTVTLWRLLPQALALPSPTQMRTANAALLASETQLRSVNASLEQRVQERTAELAAKEARLRDLLATLDLGTFMTRDLDGTIRFWSEGCAQLYGWTAAEAVGRNVHELLRTVFPVPLAEVETALER